MNATVAGAATDVGALRFGGEGTPKPRLPFGPLDQPATVPLPVTSVRVSISDQYRGPAVVSRMPWRATRSGLVYRS